MFTFRAGEPAETDGQGLQREVKPLESHKHGIRSHSVVLDLCVALVVVLHEAAEAVDEDADGGVHGHHLVGHREAEGVGYRDSNARCRDGDYAAVMGNMVKSSSFTSSSQLAALPPTPSEADQHWHRMSMSDRAKRLASGNSRCHRASSRTCAIVRAIKAPGSA